VAGCAVRGDGLPGMVGRRCGLVLIDIRGCKCVQGAAFKQPKARFICEGTSLPGVALGRRQMSQAAMGIRQTDERVGLVVTITAASRYLQGSLMAVDG
jgi:hypothetical protein